MKENQVEWSKLVVELIKHQNNVLENLSVKEDAVRKDLCYRLDKLIVKVCGKRGQQNGGDKRG
jgi:hypothetical protein